jgi:hypothetical protein
VHRSAPFDLASEADQRMGHRMSRRGGGTPTESAGQCSLADGRSAEGMKGRRRQLAWSEWKPQQDEQLRNHVASAFSWPLFDWQKCAGMIGLRSQRVSWQQNQSVMAILANFYWAFSTSYIGLSSTHVSI